MMQEDTTPFPGLVLSDCSFLDDCSTRMKCPKCNKSRKYYCYSCCIALPHLQEKLPRVELPLKVDIIKHPGELDGKSTAPHACILAPYDVTIHTYPCIPDYDRDKVIVVFPNKDSITLEDLKREKREKTLIKRQNEEREKNVKNNLLPCGSLDLTISKEDILYKNNENCKGVATSLNRFDEQSQNNIIGIEESLISESSQDLKRKRCISEDDNVKETSDLSALSDGVEECVKHRKTIFRNFPFEKVILIDCTWNQTQSIIHDERLKGLKSVELKSQVSNFWRTQEGLPKTYLSTIEAIYYFLKEFHIIFLDPVYKNEYDNLLLFFCYMYHKIKSEKLLRC